MASIGKNKECECCADNTSRIIKCPYCGYEACMRCLTHVITSKIEEPCCMNYECKKGFTFEFIREKFSATFVDKIYPDWRKKILFEQEKALLPQTMIYVEQVKKLPEDMKEIEELRSAIKELEQRKRAIELRVYHARQIRDGVLPEKNEKEEEEALKRVPIACPKNDCRGFLNHFYKCGLCESQCCKDCREIKTDDDHKCDPNVLETVKMLQKECQNCPKCAIPIFKIDGCFAKDQPILMYDGSVKMSQDIEVGDELVGDDGKKRIVLHLTRGKDEMYEVRQNNGDSYIVNSQHHLVLKYNAEEIEITIDTYLQLDEKYKSKLLGFKSWGGVVESVSEIKVIPIGKGDFYGWSVDQNKRFLAPDHTVLRNCDQIWCVKCHTAFNWKTGKVETGPIHNPHYYQYMRENGKEIPRAGGNYCGNPHEIVQRISAHFIAENKLDKNTFEEGLDKLEKFLLNIRTFDKYPLVTHRQRLQHFVDMLFFIADIPNHIRYNFLQFIPTEHDNRSNLDLRIKFLMGDIDKDSFRNSVYRRKVANQKNLEYRQVLETYTQLCNEYNIQFLQTILDILNKNDFSNFIDTINQFADDMNRILSFTQDAIDRINKLHKGRKVQKISPFV